MAVVAALLTRLIPGKEFSILLPLAAGLVVMNLVVEFSASGSELCRGITGSDGPRIDAVGACVKVLGITLVCRLGAQLCVDAEQKTLAEIILRGGDVLGLYAALPLLRAVVALVS